MGRRFCAAIAQTWLDRRAQHRDRVWAEGRSERFAEVAAEFVRLKGDVILTSGTPPVLAAKQATSVIPIVFVAGDPVGTGLVASLARPGGNITGLSNQTVGAKRLELLREIVPGLRRAVLEMAEVHAAARNLGLQVASIELRRAEELRFPSLRARASRRHTMLHLARSSAPTGFASIRWHWARGCRRCMAFAITSEAAGLMSYGPNFPADRRKT
jgi:putative ABC transport system substrate-binding protein